LVVLAFANTPADVKIRTPTEPTPMPVPASMTAPAIVPPLDSAKLIPVVILRLVTGTAVPAVGFEQKGTHGVPFHS
jgi:hypothetical protein